MLHISFVDVPTPAKFPLPPKVADFLRRKFLVLSRFMLCKDEGDLQFVVGGVLT